METINISVSRAIELLSTPMTGSSNSENPYYFTRRDGWRRVATTGDAKSPHIGDEITETIHREGNDCDEWGNNPNGMYNYSYDIVKNYKVTHE